MYRIKLTAQAKKELKILKKIYHTPLEEIFEEIKEDPYVGKCLSRELAGQYVYKIGVYRIIYKIDEKNKKVYILTAGHRQTVYA